MNDAPTTTSFKQHTLSEAREIISKGYPAVKEMLPHLMAWLGNINSSGYSEIAEFLLSIGRPVVPHIKRALQLNDVGEWHSSILYTQVRHWPREMVADVEEELDDLMWYGSEGWEVDIDAAWLLAKNNLGDRDRMLAEIKRKKESCYKRVKELEKLEEYLSTKA